MIAAKAATLSTLAGASLVTLTVAVTLVTLTVGALASLEQEWEECPQ